MVLQSYVVNYILPIGATANPSPPLAIRQRRFALAIPFNRARLVATAWGAWIARIHGKSRSTEPARRS